MSATNPASPDQSPVEPQKPAAKTDEPKPETVTLTKAELQAQIAEALEAERKAASEKAAKEKAEADEAAAREQGKWKDLYEAEKTKREDQERSNRSLRVSIALRDILASEYPDYVGSVVDIFPHIPGDVDGDELVKAAKKAASEFAARNPREKKSNNAAPPQPRPGARQSINRPPVNSDSDRPRPRFSTLNYRG
jgi:hypothetical protein